MKTHKDLDSYQKAMELVQKTYEVTSEFPDEEKYGLISQMRRAAVSIPSNIAEGAARDAVKENLQFLSYSQGSLSELETQLELSVRLGFLKREVCNEMDTDMMALRAMIAGMRRHLKSKIK